MSSKPPTKASFINTQFQPLLYNPLYNMGSSSEEVHLGSSAPNFYTRNLKSLEEEEEEGGGAGATYGLAKSGAMVMDIQAVAAAAAAAAQAQQMGGAVEHEGGLGGGGMKRWGTYEQEKSYSMSPLMEIANDNNNLLSRSACAAVDFLPLSNNANSSYNLETAQFGSSNSNKYNAQDMEILRVKQPLNTSSGSVQQHLYEHIPSSLTHPGLGISASFLANFHTHTHTPPPPSSSFTDQQLQLLGDHHHHHHHHHQWSTGSHPHAELLLLPGVSDQASPALHTHSAALPSSKLDLLHASSLHDKQAPLQQLPLGTGAPAGGTASGHLPSTAQMWHIDKLDMAVGLGLRDHGAATRNTAMFEQDVDPFASARHAHTQSGLSLFLQSPQQRAQTALSLDAARYSARSATGSVGVLRNSKYLKAAQQLLNEFCNVCRDVVPEENKSSMQAAAAVSLSQQNIWSGGGGSNGEENANTIAGEDHAHLFHRALFSATQKDMSLYSNEHYKSSIDHSLQFKQISDHHQQEKPHAELAFAGPPSPAHLDTPPPHKQLPADERCHLQMRKARLIAMVEELDRRYQQYRDQMQLIVTSFESATGMGAAAAYTTLARKAMSRQFRGLRDAISEHIRKVCKMLGEEVSTVPILSRGETPRLRLVDQRLRHQRSLQQIGMLPQQQAWRPQRGLPERSVSVLRAWLFEHFLHPYPKDSEKSMLARLTGLSRSQVSNWFINARVRLWKPMIEEMYVEESKALELSEAEASNAAAEVMQGINSTGDQSTSIPSDHSSRLSWQQATSTAPTPTPTSSFNNPAPAISFYNTRPLQRDDLNTFMHLHSSGPSANDAHAHAHAPHAEVVASHQYPWMKGIHAEHAGDIGVMTHQHDHMSLQAAAFMQGQLNASMKNGVSLTLGLQQPPPHSSYNATSIF